jgi:phospholipase C
MPTYCQQEHEPNQSWNGTHIAVNGGRMDGFVRASGDVAMGYWDVDDIPFYYSLARTFPLANRWFASAPCQTYPNRRFLHAATAYGLISTTTPGPNDPPPPNGTIFDRLNAHGISWTNYFTDLPSTAIIPATVKANPTHLRPIGEFYADCATGNLPAYSLVDPDFGLTDVAGGLVPGEPVPTVVRAQGEDEENPQNIRYGEAFVARVVNAVMSSPVWDKTLLVWLYDEHGGYYDHVPPPRAIAPDRIKPMLGPNDAPGGYDLYGLRVPDVVVSPWARPHHVSNVVHDHTSILAFVERKWNLPALTYRDANAAALLDFLDFRKPAFLEPPQLTAAPLPVGGRGCDTSDPGHG